MSNHFGLKFGFKAVICGLLFSLCNVFNLPAQNLMNYKAPAEIELPEALVQGKPAVRQGFYPIGWSKEGHFAWATFLDEADGLCRCSNLSVFIQDMTTDEIIWNFQTSQLPGGIAFEEAWNAHAATATIALSANFILPMPGTFGVFPYTTETGDVLTTHKKAKWTEDKKLELSFLSFLELEMRSKNLGSKAIFMKEGFLGVDAEVVGYVRSPFQQRIAVLIDFYHPTVQPGVFESRFLIPGCNIKDGFRKK